MKHNGMLDVAGKVKNLTLDSGTTFPAKIVGPTLFWLTRAVGKNRPGFYIHNGTEWVPISISGPLFFNGSSNVPLNDIRVWTHNVVTTSGRWAATIPTGIFTKILWAGATASTTDKTANGGNSASVDPGITLTSISGTCNDADPAGGGLVEAQAAFSPNGTSVMIMVVGQ